ncbi:MAG: proline dehydrogenase [Chloroflexi bacterium AL-W]|nr:proline dehydrogenase [Chloroflexi bacterium AL-N1]NOK64669.1 proline dehydrogenase [Chloroflexi bacterium AL-N10]NOK75910.1 proline dehydrogenase [Chloroflexi bacterium AL-N5]NOK80331.1 proline dehydrogenase [Chloroflexi bacterium AL-W]NOK86844.1 proline dehydrogenase [Chloroflexi bacterium AL-N15]
MLRGTLLYLSDQPKLKTILGGPIARPIVQRFVAGESLQDAIESGKQINANGMQIALDLLGESVHNAQDANAAAVQYIALLHAMDRAGLEAYASLKLTQMGLDIDPALCLRNVERIVAQAAEFGFFVRVDMEGSSHTQATLDLFKTLFSRHRNVGIVIQSYLYRSEGDIRELNVLGAQVRLCKGAYNEPATVAYPQKADTDHNYIRLMRLLLTEGNYPAIATHDEQIVKETTRFAAQQGIGHDQFEFQMLYGIRRDLQEQLIRNGYRMRVYMPYGSEWYPYLMRRMAERPANMMFILGGMLKERRR